MNHYAVSLFFSWYQFVDWNLQYVDIDLKDKSYLDIVSRQTGWKFSHQCHKYHQIYNISLTLVGNKIADHSDVVGASPVGAATTTSSFLT